MAWGVKETIEVSEADAVKEFIKALEGSEIELGNGSKATLLKGDVKEKKDKAILIYRYQLR
ncbi:hypothetical protein F8154_14310 [Alkaliphilus pronyensis]|uniref:Uncharacterized protein n=1 Tax=Alkaliphilus pronyensis TaxID=1482732 RepID=A0A6I0F7P0_9FIRM|nr:hypothetical protein [Alkaliphilus pronyensis]KAB3529982.1 hypothetical protein F8154_14310 [Alkaliphilus pronyensis]